MKKLFILLLVALALLAFKTFAVPTQSSFSEQASYSISIVPGTAGSGQTG